MAFQRYVFRESESLNLMTSSATICNPIKVISYFGYKLLDMILNLFIYIDTIKSIGKVYLCLLLVESWLNSCCVSYWWSNPLIYHLLNTDYPNGRKGIFMHSAEPTYPSRDLNIFCQHNKWCSIMIRNPECLKNNPITIGSQKKFCCCIAML